MKPLSIKAEEISSLIKQQLEHYDDKLDINEVGVVTYIGDGIAQAHGLNNVLANELLEFDNGSYGIAQNLESNDVGIIILGNFDDIREGDQVKRTGQIMRVPVGDALIGRVVNPLGQPVDGLGEIKTSKTRQSRLRHQVLWNASQLINRCKRVSRLSMLWSQSVAVNVN